MKPESPSTNAITRLSDALENIQAVIGGLFLFILLGVVLMDVLFRQAGTPLVWLQNIAGFTFIWVVFFGAAIGLKKGTHYCIEVVPKTGVKFRKLVDIFVFICEAIFIFVLIVYGTEFSIMSMKRMVMPSGIPMFYAVVAIPLSGVFMLCYLVEIVTKWIAKTSEEKLKC